MLFAGRLRRPYVDLESTTVFLSSDFDEKLDRVSPFVDLGVIFPDNTFLKRKGRKGKGNGIEKLGLGRAGKELLV